MNSYNINLELDKILKLPVGTIIYISGVIYALRDRAHQRLNELILQNRSLPIDLVNATIYYMGPTPAKQNQIIGSSGPTSSYRMDEYTPLLLNAGVKITIGKGQRSEEVKKSLKDNGAIYLTTIGGCGALLAQAIKFCEIVAYKDLGAEAIYRLEIKDFYAIVTYDKNANDLFKIEQNKYQNNLF